MKHLNLSIYIIFVFTVIIILLNRFTPFYIADYRVHFFFLFFAASSFMIIIGHLFKKLRSNQSIIFTFIIVGTLCLLKAFFTWEGDWKTQTLLFRNINDNNKTINFQLSAKRFSFGYKKRIVEIYHLAPFVEWTTDVDTLYIDKSKWEKLDLQLNEIGLPVEH
ncbi:MAG: hypothetical protein ABIQ27_02115 [Flavobacterium sp.]|uniref:hypothetical protein n=1 Tax=Flavobacterium sp. TaxID=239 RepID=UPI003264D880